MRSHRLRVIEQEASVRRDPEPRFRTAAVLGLGYVGLPTAAVFADAGLQVLGVDVNERVVASIVAGRSPIVETNLDALLRAVVDSGALRATTMLEPADVFVIAVPTPFKDGKKPDLAYVHAATRMIAPLLQSDNLIILESTSPVGTTEQMSKWLAERRPDLLFPHQDADHCTIHLAHCPERVLPGKVLHEVVHNERIIGGLSPRCSQAALDFYKIAVKGECHVTDARTAELCKLAENAYRDVNIAFANEMSLICDRLGVDVWELIALTNRHPRVEILRPGPGVGGHCIAVDPWFIFHSAPEEARLIHAARTINDGKPGWAVEQVTDLAAGMDNPTIACMGLAYKPDVDDLRESPSVEIAAALAARHLGRIVACEPFIEALPDRLVKSGVTQVGLDAALDADIVVFLTGHGAFREIAPSRLVGKRVFDACGLHRG